MPENTQVRTESGRRQFLQMALSEPEEHPSGNFNKAISDLANDGKLKRTGRVYNLAVHEIGLS